MTEEEIKFEGHSVSPLHIRSNYEQNIESRTKKSYGNKYMIDRKNLNIRKEHIKLLDAIRIKIGCRSYDNVIKHLCDLEAKVDPKFNITYTCKTCNEEIKDIPKHINVNKFTHRDLCTDTSCKGFIVTSKEIALDDNGHVISNNGTITTNDESSGTSEKEKETDKKIEYRMGYRNGVRISDMDDPDYDNKFFDQDLPEYKEKMRKLGLLSPTTT